MTTYLAAAPWGCGKPSCRLAILTLYNASSMSHCIHQSRQKDKLLSGKPDVLTYSENSDLETH